MAAHDDRPSLVVPAHAPDLAHLVWLDDLLRDKLGDTLRRRRLAIATGQTTLALVLEAQAATLTHLRADVHVRYWSARPEPPTTDGTLSNRG